ncbi:hypothetical protein D9M68_888890 [compost metagenome]
MNIVLKALLIGDVVAHRVALDDVAIVEQHRIAGLGADAFDDRGGSSQAHGLVGGVGIIVIGEYGDVQVGGFHQAQMGLVGLGQRRKRMHGGHGADTGGARQKRAPRDLRQEVHWVVSLKRSVFF